MSSARQTVGISLGLAALTMVAFGDLLWGPAHEFVNFDDYEYVRNNIHVQAGWSGESLRWALTSMEAFNWHPLTWISLQMDYQLFGPNPRAFQRTNVLLHALNAVLLFLVWRRMTGAVWPSAAVAAFFAAHPLHVESVAWIAERKDVLSTFFWMLTMLAYVRYTEQPGVGRYLLVVLWLTLGLMSKPMLVTLPCVLLLLDYWPLCRFPFSPRRSNTAATGPEDTTRVSTMFMILEKVPLIVLVAGCCVLTILAQDFLIRSSQSFYPFSTRLLNALVAYVAYLRQMVWPTDLAVLYVHPGTNVSVVEGLAAGLFLAVVTLLALFWRRRRPYVLVGWLWYLGTLVPVIGLLQVGQQAHADRYTYIPLVGIFMALSWGAVEWLAGRRFGRIVLCTATAVLLMGCTVGTWFQVQFWRTSTTLWDRAAQVSGDNPVLHKVAAKVFDQSGEHFGTIHHGKVLCRLTPKDWEAHQLLALGLNGEQKYDEAVASMAEAVKLEPENLEVRRQMARFFWAQQNIPAAYKELAVVARLKPDCADAQHYLGTVLQQQGKLYEAIRCFREAVRLAPGSPLYHCDLAYALEESGNSFAARGQYQEALNIYPNWPADNDRLARVQATHRDAQRRDGKEAVRRAREACFVSRYQHPPFLDTLAAAYAEAGRFKDAIETARSAKKLAEEKGDNDLAEQLTAALHDYERGKPLREGKVN
jgi:tetratricopeptide (TPR) repeat protein